MLRFRNVPVAKKIMDEGGGGVSKFSVENFFCLRVRKIFVGESFCAAFEKASGSEEVYGVERRGIRIFRQIVFVSQC